MGVIEVKGVSKKFGHKVALRNINLDLDYGDSVLLIGPNGAGKTTLLRCMLGIINFEGSILIGGRDVRLDPRNAKKLVGYVPQSIRFPEELRVYELVDFASDLKGVDVSLEEVLGPLGLMEVANAKVGSLSVGMRQRLAIALALTGSPVVILMDEPFTGLDPLYKNVLYELIRRLINEGGKTILVSSHTVSGLIHLCNKIVVMNDGVIVGHFSSNELLRLVSPIYKVHVRHSDGWTSYRTDDLLTLLSQLRSSGHEIRDAWIEEPDAGEIFKSLCH